MENASVTPEAGGPGVCQRRSALGEPRGPPEALRARTGNLASLREGAHERAFPVLSRLVGPSELHRCDLGGVPAGGIRGHVGRPTRDVPPARRSCPAGGCTSSLSRGAVRAGPSASHSHPVDRSGVGLGPARTPLCTIVPRPPTCGRGPCPWLSPRTPRRPSSEAHLPAQQPPALSPPRLPSPHGGPRRASDRQGSSPQGPEPAVGLIWRIRDRTTFVELRRRGRRGRSGPIWITHLPDDLAGSSTRPRVAYAFGRRTGNAVTRNRVRRRVRAILDDLARQDQIPPGAYLIGGDAELAGLRHPELDRHVRRALGRACEATR